MKQILIVEDIKEIEDVITQALVGVGITQDAFIPVPSTDAARLVLEKNPQQVVLLIDLDLKDYSATPFLHEIRGKYPAVVIMALSNKQLDQNLIANLGITHVLLKPFDINDLTKVVGIYKNMG